MKRKSVGNELAFKRYMECVEAFEEKDEPLKYRLLQLVTLDSGEREEDVGKGGW